MAVGSIPTEGDFLSLTKLLVFCHKTKMVTTGLEPATLGLLDQCSTNWAKRPHLFCLWRGWTNLTERWWCCLNGAGVFKLDQKCLSWHCKKEKTTLGGDRTLDHKIKSLALYHLSYEGRLGGLSTLFYSYTFFEKIKNGEPAVGFEPTTPSLRSLCNKPLCYTGK